MCTCLWLITYGHGGLQKQCFGSMSVPCKNQRKKMKPTEIADLSDSIQFVTWSRETHFFGRQQEPAESSFSDSRRVGPLLRRLCYRDRGKITGQITIFGRKFVNLPVTSFRFLSVPFGSFQFLSVRSSYFVTECSLTSECYATKRVELLTIALYSQYHNG